MIAFRLICETHHDQETILIATGVCASLQGLFPASGLAVDPGFFLRVATRWPDAGARNKCSIVNQ